MRKSRNSLNSLLPRNSHFALCISLILFALSMSFSSSQAKPPQETRKYPNSEKGFKALIDDAMEAAKKDDQTRLLELTETMVLPNSDKWFRRVFGDDFGSTYAEGYAKKKDGLRIDLGSLFLSIAKTDNANLQTLRLDSLCKNTLLDEYAILLARENHEPLSVVRIQIQGTTRTLRFFAYSDGAFRYLGNIGLPVHSKPAEVIDLASIVVLPDRIKLDGRSEEAQIIKKIQPIYPIEAREARVQGTVRLQAIISKEGRVIDLVAISGPCELTEAAYKAVLQWTFRPTMLKSPSDGEYHAVEIECVFNIVFNISSH